MWEIYSNVRISYSVSQSHHVGETMQIWMDKYVGGDRLCSCLLSGLVSNGLVDSYEDCRVSYNNKESAVSQIPVLSLKQFLSWLCFLFAVTLMSKHMQSNLHHLFPYTYMHIHTLTNTFASCITSSRWEDDHLCEVATNTTATSHHWLPARIQRAFCFFIFFSLSWYLY